MARAEYILNYRWTAVATLGGWKYNYYFYAGNSYTIPYSQPYNHGGYLFYNITLEYFEQQSQISSSKFYTHDSVGGGTYYGLDCSAFASFVLGFPSRCTTYTFETYANNSSNGFYYKDYSTVARGDLLNSNSVGHVLVVGAVSGNNISCYECTPGYGNSKGGDICYTTKTKTQWSNIGYKVVGYDYSGTGAPKDDVTERLNDPVPTQKDNSVLGGCLDAAADNSWDLSKAYSANSSNYASRTATLSSSKNENVIYFNQTNLTHQTVEATFKVTGKESAELAGKFGISFFNTDGEGFFFYCNASGTAGTASGNVTGTKVGIIHRDGANDYRWGTESESSDGAWNPTSNVILKVERAGGYFRCYVNGNKVFEGAMSSYGIDTDEGLFPQIRSFNIHLNVTKYSQTATVNSITLDGDISDWQGLETWGTIEADKKSIKDSASDKNAVFYHRLTDEGLFVYAKAKHAKTTSGNSNWWENTNFEMFVNSDAESAQFYVSEGAVEGFDAYCFKTTGSDGNYETVFEGFINFWTLAFRASYDCSNYYEGASLKIGYAFKVQGADYITPSGGTTTDYWCAENSEPRSVAHTVTKESSYAKDYSYTATDVGNWTYSGANLKLTSCLTDGDDTIYFRDNASTKQTFEATFNITGKVSSEAWGKIGIAYIDDYGDGFFFYADASGTAGQTGKAYITGTTFGIVYSSENSYMWSDSRSKSLTGATFKAGENFTLKLVRNDTKVTLYANGTSLMTLTLSDYDINNNRLVYPSLKSFNIYATVSNFGVKELKQGNITFDGDLSDWKALENWDKIQAKSVGIYDGTTTTKGVTFYTLLNDEGLFISVEAHHAIDYTRNASWWLNTNVEFFIGASNMDHQFYASRDLRRGWTKSAFVTTGSSGNYTTIFEGFIAKEYLTNICCMNNGAIKIGYAFKVDNGTTSDTITPAGWIAMSYWCVGSDPLGLPYTIKASDYIADPKYSVSTSAVANGSVSVSSTSLKAGETVTITATPASGYVVGSITVTDASGKAVTVTGNTFVMPSSAVTVKVTFNASSYNVTIGDITNGSVKVDKTTAKVGETVTVTATPVNGCYLSEIVVKDASGNTISVTNGTFKMPASNVSVTATFLGTPILTKYNVTIGDTTNGSVTVDKTTATAGETVTITATPVNGCYLGGIVVKDASGNTVSVTNGTFVMPESNVTVTVTFLGTPTTSSKSDDTTTTPTPDSSKPNDSETSSSVDTPVSSVDTPESSVDTPESSEVEEPASKPSKGGGCGGNISSTLVALLPLALIAVMVFVKKSKEQK